MSNHVCCEHCIANIGYHSIPCSLCAAIRSHEQYRTATVGCTSGLPGDNFTRTFFAMHNGEYLEDKNE